MRVIIIMFLLCNMINWNEGVSSVVASFSVGGDTNGGEGLKNKYSDATIGINATNSNFNVYWSDFNLPDNNITKTGRYGIKSISTSTAFNDMIMIPTAATGNSFYFTNADTAVYTQHVRRVTVTKATIENCKKATFIRYGTTINVTNNVMKNDSLGIGIYNSFPKTTYTYSINVTGNTFNSGIAYSALKKYGYNAIDVQACAAPCSVTVSNNAIENARVGIHARSVGNKIYPLIITGNTINDGMPEAEADFMWKPHYGIWVDNSAYTQVLNNNLQWTGGTINANSSGLLSSLRGVAIEKGGNGVVKQNYIKYYAAGINFTNICTETKLYCNTMDKCYHGSYIQFPATVSDQKNNSGTSTIGLNNQWVDFDPANQTDRVSSNNNIFAPVLRWYYKSTNPALSPNPSALFVDINVATINDPCSAPPPPRNADERENDYGGTVRDSTVDDPDSSYYKQGADEAFYKAAKEDSALLNMNNPDDSLYWQKYNELRDGNIGKLYQIKDSIDAGNFEAALVLLSAFVPENELERNLAFTYWLLGIEYDLTQDENGDTIEILNSIAYQHPFYGGEAVYVARTILLIDVENETPAMRRAHVSHNTVTTKSAIVKHGRLYPVPANESATLVYEHGDDTNISVIITNAYGQLLNSYLLKLNSISFSLSQLAPGFYYVKVCENDLVKEEHKLTIIR